MPNPFLLIYVAALIGAALAVGMYELNFSLLPWIVIPGLLLSVPIWFSAILRRSSVLTALALTLVFVLPAVLFYHPNTV